MSDFTFPKLPLLSFPLHLQTWISGSVSYLCQQQFHFSGYCVPRHWGYPQLLLTTHIQIPFGIYFFPNISVVTLLFMTCSAAAVVHVPSRSCMNYCNFRVHVSCFQFCPLESVCPGSSSAEEVTFLAPSSAHSDLLPASVCFRHAGLLAAPRTHQACAPSGPLHRGLFLLGRRFLFQMSTWFAPYFLPVSVRFSLYQGVFPGLYMVVISCPCPLDHLFLFNRHLPLLEWIPHKSNPFYSVHYSNRTIKTDLAHSDCLANEVTNIWRLYTWSI